MYTTENYYPEDLVFEDLLDEDLLDTDELDEDFFEDLDDDDLELEENFDESYRRKPRRLRAYIPRRNRNRNRNRFSRFKPIARSVKRRSNFAKPMRGRRSDLIAKGEVKKIVDAISKDVNTLKKTVLTNDKALKGLDEKFTQIANAKSRKDSNQTKVLKNMQMMSMVGSLLNKPRLVVDNLEVKPNSSEIQEVNRGKTLVQDSTLSMLLPMLATSGDSKSGKSDMNSLLPLILIMSQGGGNSGSSNASMNNMLLPIMLMTMNK